MVEEDEGHDDEDRWRKGNSHYFLSLLGLVLFPAVCANFIFPTHVTKLGSLQCAGG